MKDPTIKPLTTLNDPGLIALLSKGGVAVIPTDTVYGIVSRYDLPEAVNKVRRLKHRDKDQAFIVLCANSDQVKQVGVSDKTLEKTKKYWPGKVSIVMTPSVKYPDISGNLEGIAFRIPNNTDLHDLLLATGPLVAPSANPKGLDPALTIQQAIDYFGNSVDVYVDGGEAISQPSKLIKIHSDGHEEIIRA